MRPHPVPTPADDESDLFRNRLDNLIDMRHELVRLSGLIDWKGTVTLPCEERERSTPYGFSSRRDSLAPRGHRRGA